MDFKSTQNFVFALKKMLEQWGNVIIVWKYTVHGVYLVNLQVNLIMKGRGPPWEIFGCF